MLMPNVIANVVCNFKYLCFGENFFITIEFERIYFGLMEFRGRIRCIESKVAMLTKAFFLQNKHFIWLRFGNIEWEIF